ncbi:hypothetical protein HC031_14095 [Planosporangium thailandense]|uniref:Uncharacterized protein n=1 Tax=Planosporangium thailandense TaxID=765197 RepID=A0ABX0Y033_9ACTN|nr:hypothetical protein [Planosporangium thailandense]NJC70839.1 hypothetical protein [Planosporangium thailandense]
MAKNDSRQHLELRISIPLMGDNDEQRAIVADHILRAITHALRQVIAILTATTGSH